LRPFDSLPSGDFTVEMETGTGKTYVYLRTIFELNKRFGFTKCPDIIGLKTASTDKCPSSRSVT